MTAAPVLAADSVSCSFGGKLILDSVSMELFAGDLMTLIGPNGAGKTTFLKCLMRILPLEGGTVRLSGRDAGEMNQKELASSVSYVPQPDSRYLPFTVEEFVLTGRYPHLSPFTAISREDRAAVRESLEKTDTARFAARRMSSLSGGERQLVMIAASLAQGAGIMLLDEPAAFLDPGHELKVMTILKEINAGQGVSIIMVTHDINSAILSGGRSLVLHAGRVEYSGPSAGLARSGILEKIYGREFEYMEHPYAGCDIIMPDVIDNDGQG